MPSEPTQLPPIDVEIDDIEIMADNALFLRVRFTDNSYLTLEFDKDSPVCHELRELLDRGVNESLRRLGQRGLRVTGFTAPAADAES